jgi:hypothetical protein
VLLRVRDTGPGIAADAAAQLFNPFFTTKPPGEGTGLGLFLSYGIAESHGGTLAVDSAPGQGATFTFALPRATAEAPRQDVAPRAEPAVPSAAASAVRAAAGREPFTQALLQERPAWAGRVIVSTSAARAAAGGEPARVLRKPFNLRDLRDAVAAAWQAPA